MSEAKPEPARDPLPIAGTIGRTLRLFARMLPLGLLVLVPFEVPLLLFEHLAGDRFEDPRALYGIEGVYQIVWGVLGYAALTVVADRVDRGGARPLETLREAMARPLSRWTRVAASLFIASLVTFVLLVLGVVPGVLRWLSYAVVLPVVTLEPMGKTYPLDRSALLMRGHRWRALWVLAPLTLPELALGLTPLLPQLAEPGPAVEWALYVAATLARVLSVAAAYVLWRHVSADDARRRERATAAPAR